MINLMTINTINEMSKESFSQKEIASLLNLSPSIISRVLNNKSGSKQRQIADRMEYFLGGAAGSTGCRQDGELIPEFIDPTFEEVAFLELLEGITDINDLH